MTHHDDDASPGPGEAHASVLAALLAARDRTPHRALCTYHGTPYTYDAVADAAARVGAALTSRGVTPGERVALFLDNSPGFLITYLGVYHARGVVVPVNAAYQDVELRHLLRDSGARVCVCDAAHASLVERVIKASAPDAGARLQLTSPEELAAHAGPEPAEREPPALGPDDLAAICYTSGTTGRAKGAMLTHGNFMSNAAAVTSAWGWTDADRLLLTLPLFHMHGLGVGLHGTLHVGGELELMPRFDAPKVLTALARGDLTLFFGVPTIYRRLLDQMDAVGAGGPAPSAANAWGVSTGSQVRLFVSGSAPLPAADWRLFHERFGHELLERYGMTETVMITGNPLRGERRPGSVGLPFPGVEVRVVASAGDDGATVVLPPGEVGAVEVLPPGEVGAVEVRGPSVCRGYWRNPEATAAAFRADGWFRTGDLGSLASDGYLTLSGRAHDLIISGGFNVYPAEVEAVLAQHPRVAEVAVLGLPDDDLGEAVVAAVVPRDPTLAADELIAHAKASLASFKKPRQVLLVRALPRNALGKVQKHLLRDQLLAGRA